MSEEGTGKDLTLLLLTRVTESPSQPSNAPVDEAYHQAERWHGTGRCVTFPSTGTSGRNALIRWSDQWSHCCFETFYSLVVVSISSLQVILVCPDWPLNLSVQSWLPSRGHWCIIFSSVQSVRTKIFKHWQKTKKHNNTWNNTQAYRVNKFFK